MTVNAEELAGLLHRAWLTLDPIAPLSETHGLADLATAYAVQANWSERMLAEGDGIVGRKIGLTSRAVQEQMGVDEPDYGTLWGSRKVELDHGRGGIEAGTFLQPRVEGELAFLLGDPPAGPEVSAADVLKATRAVAPAIEIVDSRIEDWRITIFDTVADNASYGAFAVGPWEAPRPDIQLQDLDMTVSRGRQTVAAGNGSAALGDPAYAVAWLINKLGGFGVEPQAGDIVLSGAWAVTVPAVSGDTFRLEMGGMEPLELRFE
jgi:2-keto-4-pentenoate hydratase